ncbi:GPP34 family phosphoprotein [Kitasatospora sp. NPDC048365]|uniref:GOLPH3/VPS74 family protein n=1 Tax=Kitasatospora sp. NPDC048365 TaxID=3364050 RepID=UPI0037152994
MPDLPGSLPGKLFLLAYDPERGRLTGTNNLEMMLRAAALTELLQRGLLRDADGRAAIAGKALHGLDPLLAEVLTEVAGRRPTAWRHLVARRRGTVRTVTAHLAAGGLIRTERYRVLGIFPVTRVEPRDPRSRKSLVHAFEAALRDPLGRVEPGAAAMVALADAARLRLVLDHRRRREHRDRIRQLAQLTGPLPLALRQAIRNRDSSGG